MEFASASASANGFFGSQGLFRPGVRWFRAMRFASKAWIISATFLLPLLLFAWAYGQSAREAWNVATAERAGVHALRALSPRLQALAEGRQDPELLGEIRRLASTSGLLLDPVASSYFAMDAAVLLLPRMLALRGQLEAGGEAAQARWQDAREALQTSLALLAQEEPRRTAALQAQTVLAEAPASAAEVLALQQRTLSLLEELLEDRMAAQRLDALQLAAASGLSLLAAGYLFYSFALVMGGGIQMVSERVNHVAEGVLKGPSHAWGQDEFAYVASRMAEMQRSLVGTMAKVSGSANQVAAASQELSLATADLSDRTQQGTHKLREAAQAMSEVRSLSESAAQHTRQAADEAQRNAAVAEAGGAEIADAVQTMAEVQSSAARIHEIVSLIDSIAFQTNILALNAAVEAARAGESGRGFAVVASEVRTLAGRSAEAAKEIKQLIQASVASSEAGAAKVGQAGQTMGRLVESAVRLHGSLGEMAEFAQQQAQRMSSVAGAVRELDEMTELNVAMVERTSSAALNMMELASTLASEADRFALPDGALAKPKDDGVQFF